MVEVRITEDAQTEFFALPLLMQPRVQDVFKRLAKWPEVSGVKPLRGELKGGYRIRAGDYRVLFTVDHRAARLTVFRIDNRRDVYK
jgi:mRNA interferase RelE/StbE